MAEPLTVAEHDATGIAAIMARKGVSAAAVGAALGIAAPTGPGRTTNATLSLIGTGPGSWLAVARSSEEAWASRLAERLDGLASVSDQTAGYRLFRIGGDLARDLLQRGAHIDLHETAFGAGASAVTAIAHIGVIFWQADDGAGFELAVPRSYAESFRHWLAAAAAGL